MLLARGRARARVPRIAGLDDGGSKMPVQQWMQGWLLDVPTAGMLLLDAWSGSAGAVAASPDQRQPRCSRT